MSGIPSDIAGSALQAGFQARNVANARDADRAGQATNASRTTKAVDEAGSTVETNDSDVEVYADAEGTGSKGRVFEEELLEEDEFDEEESRGVSTDKDGNEHLDIEA